MVKGIRRLLMAAVLIWMLSACGDLEAEKKQFVVVQTEFAEQGNKDGIMAWDTDPQAPGGPAGRVKPEDEMGQEDIQRYLRQATVGILGPQYVGSGVIWSSNEEKLVIATAAHVIWDNSPMTVRFDQGESVEAQILHVSDQVDVAFLEVSLQEAEKKGAVWQIASQDEEVCERLEAGQTLWIMGAVEETADSICCGSVVDPWIYMEDFENYMLLGHAHAISGASGGGVFTREGVLVGILCGGNEEDQVAVLPWSVMEANRK